MNEQTQTVAMVISLEEFMEHEHPTKLEQARYMANVARTSIMMYKATGDKKYDIKAREQIQQGKDILNGFVRPLGAIFTEA